MKLTLLLATFSLILLTNALPRPQLAPNEDHIENQPSGPGSGINAGPEREDIVSHTTHKHLLGENGTGIHHTTPNPGPGQESIFGHTAIPPFVDPCFVNPRKPGCLGNLFGGDLALAKEGATDNLELRPGQDGHGLPPKHLLGENGTGIQHTTPNPGPGKESLLGRTIVPPFVDPCLVNYHAPGCNGNLLGGGLVLAEEGATPESGLGLRPGEDGHGLPPKHLLGENGTGIQHPTLRARKCRSNANPESLALGRPPLPITSAREIAAPDSSPEGVLTNVRDKRQVKKIEVRIRED